MKVKNIMFSGFAAAILMGVAAEASAAPVAVASKGYVDSVAGKLVDLEGAADEARNLVEAINVKLDPVDVLEGQVAEDEYFTAVKQETKGQVSVSKAKLATSIDNNTLKAPTTKAVYEAIQASAYNDTALAGRVTANEGNITSLQSEKEDKSNKTDTINAQSTSTQYPSAAAVYGAIQGVTYTGGADITIDDDNKINANYGSLDYESTADAADNANKLTDGYAVSYVSQVDGKVKIGAKQYTQNVNATSAAGAEGKNAPSTAAVWNAIQASAYNDTALAGRVTANEGNITSLQSEKEDKSNKTDTINAQSTSTQYPSAAAVYSAVEGVRADIPNMPEACNERGVTCVLTSEGGNFAWAILTQPVTADDESLMAGTDAQGQDLSANVPVVQNQ